MHLPGKHHASIINMRCILTSFLGYATSYIDLCSNLVLFTSSGVTMLVFISGGHVRLASCWEFFACAKGVIKSKKSSSFWVLTNACLHLNWISPF